MDTSCRERRRVRIVVIAGALAWLAAPWLPAADPSPFGSLDHGFLFFPLVVAPLVLALAAAVLQPDGAALRLHRLARRMQPFASASVLASFLVPHGPLAGALVLPWTAMAILLALAGIPAALRDRRPHLSRVNLIVAHVLLPIATGWLFAARIGVAPAAIGPLGVLLACLHFHFSGFSLQILVAATALRVPMGLAAVQRAVAIGAVVALPLISAGKLLGVPSLLALGVAVVVLATLGLAALALALALVTPLAFVRRLLFVSAGSAAVAMVLAAAFRIGEATGVGLLSVDGMLVTHGLANGLGFVGCGLLAHLRLAAAQPS